jgi:predicted negative regulator of RcsB-dependent stress response
MTNINLHQTADQQEERRNMFDSGIFIALTLLVVVLLLYGGLRAYNQYAFVQTIAENEQKTSQITSELSGSEVDRVNDFHLRLQEMERDTDTAYAANHVLNAAKVMVDGVLLNDFSYNQSDDKVVLKGSADTMGVMARQLFHLKASQMFGGVSLNTITIEETGKLAFEISAIPMHK